jgi:hypothetical protein
MTKSEARRYAMRLVAGYVEEYCFSNKRVDPLVYDEMAEDHIQGRRLSPKDYDRVCEAIMRVYKSLYDPGQRDAHSRERKWRGYKADGTAGPRWKSYEQWLKRQGRA